MATHRFTISPPIDRTYDPIEQHAPCTCRPTKVARAGPTHIPGHIGVILIQLSSCQDKVTLICSCDVINDGCFPGLPDVLPHTQQPTVLSERNVMTDKRILGIGVISLGWMGRLHARSYRAIAERSPSWAWSRV